MMKPINDRRQGLQDQLEDALIGLELIKMQEQEIEDLENTPMTDEETERMNAFFAATEQRTRKLIKDQFRAQPEARTQKRVRHMPLQKIIVAAASIVLLFCAGLASAIAVVPPVRAKVLELISSMGDGYVILGARERADTSVKVPAGWIGDYFPAYIPEGFKFVELSTNPVTAVYQSTDGKRLFFNESEDSSFQGISTEGMLMWHTVINEDEARVFSNDDRTIIAWAHNDKFLNLSIDGSSEIAIKIAQSIRLITQK